MAENKRKVGSYYEQLAAKMLELQGYQIVERNYHCHFGEIDLIAKDGDTLVFCEVKYRKNGWKGEPEEAVDKRKQAVIGKCAYFYLMEHRLEQMSCRFDVIAIKGEMEHRKMKIIRGAFEL